MRPDRKLAAFLLVFLIFSLIPAAYLPAEQENVININSLRDFIELADDCSLDTFSQGKTVQLNCDIDVSDSGFTSIPTFGGVFNGNGHTVSGLTISKAGSAQGLFRYIQQDGQVLDLNVSGAVRASGSKKKLGGIAGVNYGRIVNCTFSGTVDGQESVGGIAGINEPSGYIKGCRSSADITGDNCAGGIAGKNLGSIYSSVNNGGINTAYTLRSQNLISSYEALQSNLELLQIFGLGTDSSRNSVADEGLGDVIEEPGSFTDAGGIAGYSSGIIQNCENTGKTGYPHVGYNVGGIAGRQNGYLADCKNSGEILGRKNIGGIVGLMEPNLLIEYSPDTFQMIGGELQTMSGLFDNLFNDLGGSSDSITGEIDNTLNEFENTEDVLNTLAHQTSGYVSDTADSINNSSERITNAIRKSKGVFSKLESSADLMSEAAEYAADGFGSLQAGSAEVNAAMDAVSNAFDKFAEAADSLNEATEAINKALDELEAASNDAETQAALADLRSALADAQTASRAMNTAMQDAAAAFPGIMTGDPEAFSDLQAAFTALLEGSGELAEVFSQMRGDLTVLAEQYSPAVIDLINALVLNYDDFSDAMFMVFDGFSELNSVFSHLYSANEDLTESFESFKQASRKLSLATGELSDAAGRMEKIVTDLTEQPIIELPVLDPSYEDNIDQLHDSLQKVTSHIENINRLAAASNSAVIDDLKKISAEMDSLGRQLADIQNTDTNLYEDVSGEELFNAAEGKTAYCENTGTVQGDICAGGIAGTISIYNKLNPENDLIKSSGAKSLNFIYRTKAIVCYSYNRGKVLSKKNCAGGIAGEADLGTIFDCRNYGDVNSADGSYVGGIAGSSLSNISSSYALSDLGGKSYVGGIAGSGANIDHCYAFIRINSEGEYLGSIAGEGTGTIADNCFVDNEWHGIDGISYSGKAMPQEYQEFIQAPGMPAEFKMLKLRFVADGKEIAIIPFNYGESVAADMLPEIPEKDGYSESWPDYDYSNLTFNATLEAEYDPYITAIASQQTRGEPQRSILLAESLFTKAAYIKLTETDDKTPAEKQNILESWAVNVNGLYRKNTDEITYRYLAPDTQGKIHIWVNKNSGWEEADYKTDGSYIVFKMAPQGKFAVTVTPLNYLIIGGAAAFLIFLAIFILLYLRRKPARAGSFPDSAAL